MKHFLVCECVRAWVGECVGEWVCACVCVGGGCGCGCMGVWVFLRACSLSYPACNTHCHLRPLWLRHNFCHYNIKGTTFGKKYIYIYIRYKMYKVVQIWPGQTVTCLHTYSPGHIWTTLYVLVFSTTLIWNITHFNKNAARYCHKCQNVFL